MADDAQLAARHATAGAVPTVVPTGRRSLAVARDAGRLDDPHVRDLIGEGHMLELVNAQLQRRLGDGVASGRMSEQSASIGRLVRRRRRRVA